VAQFKAIRVTTKDPKNVSKAKDTKGLKEDPHAGTSVLSG